jgi:DNA-binding NarL/FixJ family response regulator
MTRVTDAFNCHEHTAQQNWAQALQTYRFAVATYRRFLDAQVGRSGAPPEPARLDGVVAIPGPIHQIVPHTRQLDCLTRREREVADLIARGCSNQQIAETLVVTRGTVANHVAHILAKVGVANRTQVAARVLDGSVDGQGPRPVVLHRSSA